MFSIIIQFLCFLIILSSILVISSQNSLHSILFLVLSFFFSALTIFSLENEFLALFFLIIYLGAIIVLFLFVVMMLDLKRNILIIKRVHAPIALVIGAAGYCGLIHSFQIFVEQSLISRESEVNFPVNWYSMLDEGSDVVVLGNIFYHNYAAQIILSGLLLYVSVIGVVFLTTDKYGFYK